MSKNQIPQSFRFFPAFFYRFSALAKLAGLSKTRYLVDLVGAYGLQYVNDIKALKSEKEVDEIKVISTAKTVKKDLAAASKERAEKAAKK